MSKIYIKINFLEFTALCADLKPSQVFESAAKRHFQKLGTGQLNRDQRNLRLFCRYEMDVSELIPH
jgi:hypothetical protein